MKIRRTGALSTCLGLLLGSSICSVHAAPVDVELQLLVDVGLGYTDAEYDAIIDAYSGAIRDVRVWNAIADGDIGEIAMQFIFWSDATNQTVVVDWSYISDQVELERFALLAATGYRGDARTLTAPQTALQYGAGEFADNGFEGTRQVMNISSDGVSSDDGGATLTFGRDAALAAGVDSINALVLGTNVGVVEYYDDYVIGGTDSFLLTSEIINASDILPRLVGKLETEIRPGSVVPIPASVWMFGSGLMGLMGLARRHA